VNPLQRIHKQSASSVQFIEVQLCWSLYLNFEARARGTKAEDMHHHEHHHGHEHHHEHVAPQPLHPGLNKGFGVPPPPPRASIPPYPFFEDVLVEEARMEVQDAVAEVLVTCSDLCQQQQQQPQFFNPGHAPQPAQPDEDLIEWAQGFFNKPTDPYDDITFEPKFLEPAAFAGRAREVVSEVNVGMADHTDHFTRTEDSAFKVPSRSEQLRCIFANQEAASDACRGSLAHLQDASMQLRYAADGPYDDAAAAAGVSCLFLVLLILFLPLAILKAYRRRAAMHKAHKIFRAIDSNPELRAAVEAAAGESLSRPLSSHVTSDHDAGQVAIVFLRVAAAITCSMLFITLMAFALVPGDSAFLSSSSSSSSDGSDGSDGGIGDLLFTFNPFAIAVWWLLCIMAFIGIKATVGSRNSVGGTPATSTTTSAASAPPAGIAYPAYNYHAMTGTGAGAHVSDSHTANETQQYVPPVPTAGTNAV
jgi:hypothetical protein